MKSTYWSDVLRRQISRRRALAATGATAASAAVLAACGSSKGGGVGSNAGSGGANDKSGLISTPVDTTKQARRGGVARWFQANEPAHMDIHIGLAPLNTPNNLVNDNLVNEKAGFLKPAEYSEVIPDLAESWEWSPDRLQLTFKLRPGIKWHNKAPVNGRAFDVEDVVNSWNRFAAKGQGRATVSNAANPNAPVLSATALDARTVAFKLKDPVAYFLSQVTPGQTGNYQMVPKETDNGFDNRKDLIGTGAYVLTNYSPSQSMTFERNPDYWDAKSGAYFDKIEFPFITEYAQLEAQFRAGNIYTLTTTTTTQLRQENALAVKRDIPDMVMHLIPASGFSPGNSIEFGVLPTEANKPFKDERVRQALHMAIDRDAYADVFYNVAKFQSEGVAVQNYWYTSIGPAPGWRLDPKDAAKFGPNAKYFQHDIAEAKKLLAAAGYGNGLEIISSYIAGSELGADFQKRVEVRQDMLRDIGVKPVTHLIDYTLDYLTKYLTAAGKFDGIVYRSGVASANDAVTWLDWRFKSGGGDGWVGFDARGVGDGSGDPEVDAMILKARAETDTEKRRAIVFDLQRYLAKACYMISEPSIGDSLQLAWPALANYNVFQGDRRTQAFNWWLDDSKAPVKKA